MCSAADLGLLHEAVDAGFVRVTPGIRLASEADDQRRVTTPGDAVRAGADYLVIGRPVTTAPDPIAVLDLIEHDIATRGG